MTVVKPIEPTGPAGLAEAARAQRAVAAQPLLPLRLFADKGRAGAYAARALFLGSMVSFFFFSTQLMQGVLHLTPVQAGFGFLPMTGVTFLASLMLPRLLRRFGSGLVLAAAFLCVGVGLVWLAQEQAGASYGAAAGLVNAAHRLGGTLGLAVLVTVFAAAMRGVAGSDAALAQGISAGLYGAAALQGLGLMVTLLWVIPADRAHKAASAA